MFDWDRFEAALLDSLLAAANEGGPYRAVALSHVYSETDGIISAPWLGLNTDGEAMDSPADWEFFTIDWAPEGWFPELVEQACSGSVEHWEATYARYQEMIADICRDAGARLGIPVFYLDGSEREEELLSRSLTEAQLDVLFPYVRASRERRAQVEAMPVAQQVAYHVDHQDDEALRALDSEAIPALLALLHDRERDRAWWAAKLLADIGIPDPEVIAALSGAVDRFRADTPDQLWACRALARLGRLDLVLDKGSALSPEAITAAVAAPYTAFRDAGERPPRLDYLPLEGVLSRYPQISGKVAEELAPGSSYCVISAAEVPEAMRGAGSTHVVVRKHAVCVLGERALGETVGERVIPLLRDAARSDPDDEVRRLAALSLRWWKASA